MLNSVMERDGCCSEELKLAAATQTDLPPFLNPTLSPSLTSNSDAIIHW